MKEGIVVKSTGSWYLIKDSESKELYEARIRGKFKKDNIRSTNPLAVGDIISYNLDNQSIAWIVEIKDRKNYIVRKSVNLSKSVHILASNIDQAFMIYTIENPKTSLGFLNRFLITCEAYRIPVSILINKIDLINSEENHKELRELKQIYQQIGYEILEISAVKDINIDQLKERLISKNSLFFGHSGSGKTSIINKLNPKLDLKIGDISNYNQKGKHTTTFAQMHEIVPETYVVDIPGIKEFELVDIDKEELQHYFPEIFEMSQNCRFNNCLHINEPNCAVIQAVKNHEISEKRYKNYLKIFEDL